ncbi:hypothetical protein C2S51_018175 [Perilla frutescens var. frutescens]|nr:hypothetical protein C2S51_018175 [Perilla frutescens var. frutescens]
MEMKTKMKSCTLCILFWGLLIFPVNGDRDCVIGILPSLNPCQESFLGNTLPSKPSAECCNGVKKFSALGTSTKLCGCLKLYLLSSQILHSKLNSIPHLCNIPALSPAVNCATATDGGFDQLKNAEPEPLPRGTLMSLPGAGAYSAEEDELLQVQLITCKSSSSSAEYAPAPGRDMSVPRGRGSGCGFVKDNRLICQAIWQIRPCVPG